MLYFFIYMRVLFKNIIIIKDKEKKEGFGFCNEYEIVNIVIL